MPRVQDKSLVYTEKAQMKKVLLIMVIAGIAMFGGYSLSNKGTQATTTATTTPPTTTSIFNSMDNTINSINTKIATLSTNDIMIQSKLDQIIKSMQQLENDISGLHK
jgi:low affinity Fe/Cu permease